MKRTRRISKMALALTIAIAAWTAIHAFAQAKQGAYRVLAPVVQGNLAVFPVASDAIMDTSGFATLDEGIRSGHVVITEAGANTGLVRPRRVWPGGFWTERPPGVGNPGIGDPGIARQPMRGEGIVNRLALVNNGDRPLLLLAGEIVVGGKQDRIVGTDLIVPAHSQPLSLEVFCVEPYRWESTSTRFDSFGSSMAQPSIRQQAMARNDQQGVWNEVNKARSSFAAGATPGLNPGDERASQSTSSYAKTMQNPAVADRMKQVVTPLNNSYDQMLKDLKTQHAIGAVVAVNGEMIWADVFASSELLEKYWPKLIGSYAAEALSAPPVFYQKPYGLKIGDAQAFLDDLRGSSETSDGVPGVYRSSKLTGDGFEAFLLTSLLPGKSFDVHIAKMRN